MFGKTRTERVGRMLVHSETRAGFGRPQEGVCEWFKPDARVSNSQPDT